MPCPECAAAEHDPTRGIFDANCKECRARWLAQGPAYWEANHHQVLTHWYRQELQKCFGTDWEPWHARVKAWAERIKESRS